MPGRTFVGTTYRYGFNGKLKDDELKGSGNSYDFDARIYDPRVGRFLSIDPLTKKYPMLTPYCFAGDNPIQLIDKGGLGPELPPIGAQNALDREFQPKTSSSVGTSSVLNITSFQITNNIVLTAQSSASGVDYRGSFPNLGAVQFVDQSVTVKGVHESIPYLAIVTITNVKTDVMVDDAGEVLSIEKKVETTVLTVRLAYKGEIDGKSYYEGIEDVVVEPKTTTTKLANDALSPQQKQTIKTDKNETLNVKAGMQAYGAQKNIEATNDAVAPPPGKIDVSSQNQGKLGRDIPK